MRKVKKPLVVALVLGLSLTTIGYGYMAREYNKAYQAQQEVVHMKEIALHEQEQESEKLASQKTEIEKELEDAKAQKEELIKESQQSKEESKKLKTEVAELEQSLKTKREKEQEQLAVEDKDKNQSEATPTATATTFKSEPTPEPKEPEPTGNTMNFTATHYAIGDQLTPGTVTANGTDVSSSIYTPEGYRVIAVDPNVIPLNSIVRVTTSNGQTFTAKACDTGSSINGNKIDILVSSPQQALDLGVIDIQIEVIG